MSAPAFAVAYLQSPFVVCHVESAATLAQIGWHKLAEKFGLGSAAYSIANCLGAYEPPAASQPQFPVAAGNVITLETPDFKRLIAFYDEHGLEPLTAAELVADQVLPKIQRALSMLAEVPSAYACVSELVKTIQVLRSPDAEIDVSYSHPAIPFSIFVSVCEDDSLRSSLRVAEAILHEAMHLQLTLLEGVVDLVKPGSTAVYYSPWRDEDRPVRGVLHGMFVFRAVRDFYTACLSAAEPSEEERDFIIARIQNIEKEINSLLFFSQIDALTTVGKQLVLNLTQFLSYADNQLLLQRIYS